ncbi:glycerol-3-phosphate dehydrogenase/oxidase [Segetibacter sp. 3557_3]|uniref:glycerol-3-phosphate dehydrogenase/oxidase n=1 Tax=Segetibacter sp. 3557_3 TaxID=2547429 RepID=UPI0010583DEF|nr:glycerol-3-phosphate dehydrogenase/oxidase [Segetibacter sp. 3557_3]TDH28658.1 glycerol-3-phosphate dehydrogenase/oxidase [Segetibacter sp. 3557_3]
MFTTAALDREKFIRRLNETDCWDVVIVGGGATGLGIAVDSASRGYATLLLEQSDFAKGTSSRSTKLVHGGVRYLAQGDIRLVYAALRERGLLLKNAPHLVKRQPFIIPCYSWFSKMKYLVGLKMYDWLSGRFSFGKSRFLNKKETLAQLPGINPKHLTGGIEYFDGQFDDARLAVNLAQTAAENGGTLLNYFKVTGLLKDKEKVSGIRAVDIETNKTFTINSKVVINATGVFVDDVLQMDKPGSRPIVRPSQGVHVVVDKSFLNGKSAMMIPETEDGRVLFAVPWHNHLLLGTTDTPLEKHSMEPVALDKEVSFILETVKQYMTSPPTDKDVLSVFAGLRPLAAPDKDTNSTKEISRDHKLFVSESGLITITGGKWTTYRKMGEETVDKAITVGSLHEVECRTKDISIHGCAESDAENVSSYYGTDYKEIEQLIKKSPELGKRLVAELSHTEAEVVWATRNEMARTVEDVLARRLRLLFLDAKAAIQAAPRVAELMSMELGYDEAWEKRQVLEFNALAGNYILAPSIKLTNEKIPVFSEQVV